ncbi:Ku protein [Streptomyces sp. NPDC004752]
MKVLSATDDHSVGFHHVHREGCGGRIRYRKFCELGDREVPNTQIGKGYDLFKTQVIPLSDEELRQLPLPTARAIEIDAFVPLESIDPIRISDGYYLAADGPVAAKPYKLLANGSVR